MAVAVAISTGTKMTKPRTPILDLIALRDRPGHLARRLHQICTSIFLNETKDLNLTAVQMAALQTIALQPGIEQVTLGRLVAMDRQNASNLVSRLTARGLIDKKAKDKRTHALYITEEGLSLVEEVQTRVQAIDDKILSPLTNSEKDVFLKLLSKLTSENNELSRAPIGKTN